MPGRKVTVQLIGDSAQLEKSFDRAARKGKSFGGAMGSATSSLKGLGKAGAIGAAVGGAALLTKGLSSSIAAAKEAQVAQVKLKQALKSSGNSFSKYGGQIDSAIQKTSKLAALDDEELSDSFSNLVRTSGSVAKATKGMALAANIARARNIPLATAAKAVEKAYKGSVGGLARYGVVVSKSSQHVEVLKAKENALRDAIKSATGVRKAELEAQLDVLKSAHAAAAAKDKERTALNAVNEATRKFAGSADAYGKTAAGAQQRFQVAIENLQESIGTKLLPVLTKLTLKAVKFLEWSEKNWPRLQVIIDRTVERVKTALNAIQPILDAIKVYLGGWLKIVEGILTGDWAEVWAGIKQVVRGAIQGVIAYLKTVPPLLLNLGLRMGKALADGVIAGIGNLVDRIVDKIPFSSDSQFQKVVDETKAKARAKAPRAQPAAGIYAGPRARGGPVQAGRSYLIGERGPEMFTPGRSGGITPRGGGISIGVVHVHGVQNVRQLLDELQRIGKHGTAQQRGRYGGQNLALT